MDENLQWIVGIVLSLIAILQTWRVHVLSTRRRFLSLGYRDDWEFSNTNLPYSISATFANNYYDQLLYIEIEIANFGDAVLTKDDFATPILIKSDNKLKILDYQIVEGKSVDQNFELINVNENNLSNLFEVKFNRLEKGKKFKFNVLCAPSNLSPKLEFDLIYANQVKQDTIQSLNLRHEENVPRSNPFEIFGLLLIFGYFALYYYSFIYAQKYSYYIISQKLGFARESSEIISFFIALFPPLILLAITVFLFGRWYKKRKEYKIKI